MKYFQILLLLGINISTILLSQSIEIPHKMMNQNTTFNIPIFIYDVSNLESIQLKIEYDETIVNALEIIENPVGILDGGYTFTPKLTEPGIIQLAIVSNSENLFSGSGMLAQIVFQSIGDLGEFSALKLKDAQINSELVLGTAIDGSIEIVLDELTVTAVDQSGIGSDDFITFGMCETCTDGWRYGEDEYDNPDPQNEYTNIHFYHSEWLGQEDVNDNTCDQVEFASDFRSQHSFRELSSWGIKGSIGGDISSDIPINLSWDSGKLISNSYNFKMFLYVGSEDGIDMQDQNSITISQSDLTLNENNEPNIWVKMGGCADTGETITYYQDFDGDDLGGSVEREFCEGLQPEGWVDTNDGDICNGEEDCLGTCGGYAITDECGVCDLDNNNNNQCYDCNFVPNGGAELDNCGNCILAGENTICEMDCSGNWGGSATTDDCDICGGNQIDGDFDGDGDICETECTEDLDCNGDCGGSATTDDCDICVGGNSGQIACIQDCTYDPNDESTWEGAWGGNYEEDLCGICDADSENNDQCVDCNGTVDGDYELDNCGVCDNDSSNNCDFDCTGEWGGGASFDNCQICAGGSTDLIPCEQDCKGDWGGNAFMDECDVCDSDNNNNNQCFDCNLVPNGGAIVDNCNECILEEENNTCEMDCSGNWGGSATTDDCDICGGNQIDGDFDGDGDICETECTEDLDCNGDCGGSATTDDCDICVGGNSGQIACIQDCTYDPNDESTWEGAWGGNSENDLCGICDADIENNDQCLDCNGTVEGLAYRDNCGNCVSDSSDECEQDCNGAWGGTHPPTFFCENGDIACNENACFDLTNDDLLLPLRFDINRIYPNPFNPQATIDFEVSEPTRVHLNIYNLKGQKVNVLKNAFTLPGHYSVIWNGTNHPSGIYFVILNNRYSIIRRKIILLK